MTATLLRRLAEAIGGYVAALRATATGQAVRLIKEWHYRADIHKVQAMSDRQLSDIGLSRSP